MNRLQHFVVVVALAVVLQLTLVILRILFVLVLSFYFLNDTIWSNNKVMYGATLEQKLMPLELIFQYQFRNIR